MNLAKKLNLPQPSRSTTKRKKKKTIPKDPEPRAPIVTVMGHVDHGKTSLLDHIRSANVASGEGRGITQHVGAYEVLVNGKNYLPGYTGSRSLYRDEARGCQDHRRVIIVVAADDHIMPQTKEAISMPWQPSTNNFAINKIDKDGADPERIKQELASMNFLVEDWGGPLSIRIYRPKGINVDKLLEKVLLQVAEMLELKANPKGQPSELLLKHHWQGQGLCDQRCWSKTEPSTSEIRLWQAHTAVRSKPCSTKRVKTQIGRSPNNLALIRD